MSSAARKIDPDFRKATYQDLLEVPDHLVAEILDGELFTSPRPATRHARSSSSVGGSLFGKFDRDPNGPDNPGGWWILFEPEIHFEEQVLVPDIAGWRRSRMPQIPDVPFFTLPPDFICEVLSPSTMRLDRMKKMPVYAQMQVPHVWLIDPKDHLLEVFALEPKGWYLVDTFVGNDKIRAVPFEAVELEMKDWWIDP